jgi:hypothetical protein
MEADWSVELAATDPVIAVPWAACGDDEPKCRFVDLRLYPHLVAEIKEAQESLVLRTALLLLNSAASHFWTAKCDAWSSSPEQGDDPFDPYEMDAEPGDTAFGAGSYIDLLPRDLEMSQSFDSHERWLRVLIERLRGIGADRVRVELVLRRALVDAVPGYGVTWFVEGCGATAQRAEQAWGGAFDLALAAIMDVPLK